MSASSCAGASQATSEDEVAASSGSSAPEDEVSPEPRSPEEQSSREVSAADVEASPEQPSREVSAADVEEARENLVGVWRADLEVLQEDPDVAANSLLSGLLSNMRIQWRFESGGIAETHAQIGDASTSDPHRWRIDASEDGQDVELSLLPPNEEAAGTEHALHFENDDRVEISNAVRFEDGWVDLSFFRVDSRQRDAESTVEAHIEMLYGIWELDREQTYEYLVASVGEDMADAFTQVTSTLTVDEEGMVLSLQHAGADDAYPYRYEVESSRGATLTLNTHNNTGESARMRIRFLDEHTVVISDPESSEEVSGAMVYVQMSEGGEPLPEE